MSCVGCKKPVSKRLVAEICVDCRFNQEIVMSTTEAKKRYMLTDNDIAKAKLFSISFNVHGNVGTKYLISEIEQLAYTLSKDLPDTDKRKIAYTKQKAVKDEVKLQKDKLNDLKLKLKDEVMCSLSKYNIPLTKSVIDNIDILIASHCKDCNINVFATATRIIDEVNRAYIAGIEKQQRTTELDDLINKNIDANYIKKAYEIPAYNNYIQNNTYKLDKTFDLNKTFELIQSNIQMQIQKVIDKENRKKQLDKMIHEKIGEKYMSKIQTLSVYENFITDNNYARKYGIDETFSAVCSIIQKIIDKDNRKTELHYALRKGKIRINDAKKYEVYNNYIEKNKDTVDDVVTYIKNEIEAVVRREEFDKIINNKLKSVKKYKCFKFYYDYAYGKITLEEAIRNLDEQIKVHKLEQECNDRILDLYRFINKYIRVSYRKEITDSKEYKQYIIDKQISFEEIKNHILKTYDYALISRMKPDDRIGKRLLDFYHSSKSMDEFSGYNKNDRKKIRALCNEMNFKHTTNTINGITSIVANKPIYYIDDELANQLIAEVGGGPKIEPKIEPTIEPKIEPMVEPKIEPIVEPKIEPKIEQKIEPVIKPKQKINKCNICYNKSDELFVNWKAIGPICSDCYCIDDDLIEIDMKLW